jgi:hypothetical protein
MKPALPIAITIAAAPAIALGVYFHLQNVAFGERSTASKQALSKVRLPPIEPAPIRPQAPSSPAQGAEPTGAAVPTAAPTQAGAPPPIPATPPSQQASEDARQYDANITYYEKAAGINNSYIESNMGNYREAARLGSTKIIEDTKATLKETAHFVDMARCLKDQKARGAAFYQGKATCEAAFPGS